MEVLEIIYSDKAVMAYIRKKVEEVSSVISDTDKLETRIFKKLVKYYAKYTKRSIKRIRKIVDMEIGDALEKRMRKERTVVFSSLAIIDDFGESLEYEPTDVLADVEREVVGQDGIKKIALLAKSEIELFVIKAWSDGITDTEVSKALASRFGGNFEKYRKTVQRFKNRCRVQLESVASTA